MSPTPAYKCGSGAVMTSDPRGTECCINCEHCTCQKGYIIEHESCRVFIPGVGQ